MFFLCTSISSSIFFERLRLLRHCFWDFLKNIELSKHSVIHIFTAQKMKKPLWKFSFFAQCFDKLRLVFNGVYLNWVLHCVYLDWLRYSNIPVLNFWLCIKKIAVQKRAMMKRFYEAVSYFLKKLHHRCSTGYKYVSADVFSGKFTEF